MGKILAIILFAVLVFGGAVGCIIKALLGIGQRRFLPKAFTNMYENKI